MKITAIYADNSHQEFRVDTPRGVDFESARGESPQYFVVSPDITSAEKEYLENRCRRGYVDERYTDRNHMYFEEDF